MSDNLTQALNHAERGWYVFPCKPDKRPYTQHGKDDATTDQATIRAWWVRWPDALIGIYCEKSGFFALDIDRKNGVDGGQIWKELVEAYGAGVAVPAGPIQQTPSGGNHVLFSYPLDITIPNNASKLGPGLDLRSNGYICTGGPYAWLPEHGPEVSLTEAPGWFLELIRNSSAPKKNGHRPNDLTPAHTPEAGDYWLNYYLQRAAPGSRNDMCFAMAGQLRDSGVGLLEAETIASEYSRRVPGDGFTEAEALASIRSAYSGARREAATLPGFAAKRNGHHRSADIDLDRQPPEEKLHLTDMGNARRFALQHAGRVCFVHAWGWMVWTGKKWERDETGHVMRLAKESVRRLYREAERAIGQASAAIKLVENAATQDDQKALADATKAVEDAKALSKTLQSWAIKSQGYARLESMLALAKSELEIVARPEEFDNDPWALNVQNGILDLRTGQLQPHNPGLKMSKIAGAEYDQDAKCPIWLAFLDRIFSGDQELISYMQRAAGYSMTGDVREQALFFLYGSGANGKSTFTGTLQELLGDYSMKVRAETLMMRKNDSSTEDQAQLPGVRFMLAAELGEGQRLNESLIKDLTGYTDRIRARLLYKDSFEFLPVVKPWLYGNHKPIIRGTDNGIWRRPRLIPFEVAIPQNEQDKDLPNKLRAELPGILTWCMNGCMKWQKDGEKPPAKVLAATAQFRAEQDIIAAFLEECCVISDLATVSAGELLSAYNAWAQDGNIKPISSFALSRAMEERGFSTKGPDGKPRRDHSAGEKRGRAFYAGIGLLTLEPQERLL